MNNFIGSVVLFFVLSISFAQEKEDEKKLFFGLKAGFNVSSVSNIEKASSKVSYHIGGFAEFSIADRFSLQPEIVYSCQGVDVSNGTYNFNYVNIPIMAKFYATPSLSFEAGPQIGFLVEAKAKPTVGGSYDVKEFFKTNDIGVNFGASYDVDKNIDITLRYNLGLSQLQKELEVGEKAAKNSAFQLSVGYRF